MTSPRGQQDWADRHVARWRDHWIDVTFDDQVEAIFVRLNRLHRFVRDSDRAAIAESGLQAHEFATLHQLMIRDTPGTASPTALAEELGVSGAGMTGRIDALARDGLVQRRPSTDDRRRVDVEVTRAGVAAWRATMAVSGRFEEELAGALTERERATLARLLRKLTLAAGDT